MTTPYEKKFRKDTIIMVHESGTWFHKGALLKLARDDGSELPYFESLISGEVHCIYLSRLRAATEAEIATLNERTEPSEEENEMTRFQQLGYTKDTVFIRPDGRKLQLREDDDTTCPFFNFAGTSDFSGCEWLSDLVVFEDKEKEAPVEEGVLLSTEDSLEGLIFLIKDTRAELIRLEALMKQKSAEMGITIIVGDRPSAQALCQEQSAHLIETADQAWTLKEGDTVTVSAKPDADDNILDQFSLESGTRYTVNRTDLDDKQCPILINDKDGDPYVWIPIEAFNLHKVS